jgi:hypothetical protein
MSFLGLPKALDESRRLDFSISAWMLILLPIDFLGPVSMPALLPELWSDAELYNFIMMLT